VTRHFIEATSVPLSPDFTHVFYHVSRFEIHDSVAVNSCEMRELRSSVKPNDPEANAKVKAAMAEHASERINDVVRGWPRVLSHLPKLQELTLHIDIPEKGFPTQTEMEWLPVFKPLLDVVTQLTVKSKTLMLMHRADSRLGLLPAGSLRGLRYWPHHTIERSRADKFLVGTEWEGLLAPRAEGEDAQ
jgi:hypothetical protein